MPMKKSGLRDEKYHNIPIYSLLLKPNLNSVQLLYVWIVLYKKETWKIHKAVELTFEISNSWVQKVKLGILWRDNMITLKHFTKNFCDQSTPKLHNRELELESVVSCLSVYRQTQPGCKSLLVFCFLHG